MASFPSRGEQLSGCPGEVSGRRAAQVWVSPGSLGHGLPEALEDSGWLLQNHVLAWIVVLPRLT